jgi:serine protease inhibitor
VSGPGVALGFGLLGELLRNRASPVLSPLSAALALDMVAQGARGETGAAMARVLGRDRFDREAARREAAALLADLDSADGVTVELAGGLWVAPQFPLRPAFLEAVADYRGEARCLDLASLGAPAVINRWVRQRTHGQIESVVDRFPPDSSLFLVNAAYFRGEWDSPFDPGATAPGPFTTPQGEVTVPLMRRSGSFDYAERPDLQAVGLAYRGGRFQLVVVLPRHVLGPEEFQQLVEDAWWERLVAEMVPRPGEVALPRCRIEARVGLSGPLSRLGMGAALGPAADFSGISESCDSSCHLTDILQRVAIEVDERGTVAAAATAVAVAAVAFVRPFRVVVDRPFMMGVVDRKTGALLFLAVVLDPSSGQAPSSPHAATEKATDGC